MASLSAPTTLAIFHAQKQKQPAAHSSSHISLAPVDGSNGRLAVAAVRGDGIWTYDLRTLKPTTSFTVRPEVEFSTGPVSYYREAADDAMEGTSAAAQERITAVGVQSGGRLSKAEHGRALWIWPGEDAAEHTQIILSHPVAALLSTCISTHPLVAITTRDVVFFSADLTPHALALPAGRDKLVQARIQSLPSQTGARIVLIYENGSVLLLKADFEELAITSLGESGLPGLPKHEKVVTGDVAQDGTVTAITSTRRVISASIRPSPSSLFAPQPAGKSTYQRNPSTPPLALSLPSSSTPLAVVASASSLLLVTSSSALLASSSQSASIVSLSALAINGSTTTLGAVLSYESPARAQIVLIEAHVPATGVGIAHLLGSASATAVEFTHDLANPAPVAATSSRSPINSSLLAALEVADEPSTVWKAYLATADQDAQKSKKEKTTVHALNETGLVRAVLEFVFKRALGSDGLNEDGSAAAVKGVYGREVVESLLSRKLVVNEYYEADKGGVLAALLALEDWTNAATAIQNLPSVPAGVAVRALNHPEHTEAILRALVQSQIPVPAYRAALRRGIQAESAMRILSVLLKWVEGAKNRRFDGIQQWADGVEEKKDKSGRKRSPDLETVLAQSNIIMDALLPVLIQHEPAHVLLAQLNEALAPLIQVQAEMQALQYPVQAFLTLAKRDEKKAFRDLGNEGVGKWRVEDFLF